MRGPQRRHSLRIFPDLTDRHAMAFHPKGGSGLESLTESVAEGCGQPEGGPQDCGVSFADAGDCSFEDSGVVLGRRINDLT